MAFDVTEISLMSLVNQEFVGDTLPHTDAFMCNWTVINDRKVIMSVVTALAKQGLDPVKKF